MADVIVIGGGLAGLAAAAALGGAGHSVRVFESRPYLGGRATSYEAGSETIDNCQHILLGCCVNLLDFYERLGVGDDIKFYREYVLIEPGGRRSLLRAGFLPPPLHFTGSLLALNFLNWSEKLAVIRAMLAIRREYSQRDDLERISMQQWLEEKRQPPRAIERFWRQVLVSAISEELDRMAAIHAFQVFRLGFMARSDAFDMGVPAVPLGRLYRAEAWRSLGNSANIGNVSGNLDRNVDIKVDIRLRAPIERVVTETSADGNTHVRCVIAGGQEHRADYYICALPFERLAAIGVDVDVDGFEYSPITGIHLWFDRPVIDVPQATMFDRTIQWVFDKGGGKYVQVVVSASRSLIEMPRADVIALAVRELAEFFPAVSQAKLEKAHVVKEVRAVFSPLPGLESRRPPTRTATHNLFLAGDWTRCGWPATMEAAVRSGYLAAEAVSESAGAPQKFLLPDIA
jgi:squalene-associated FAD-dependent desaturase